MAKKKKKKRRADTQNEPNIIDINTRREENRRMRQIQAEAVRAKRGHKSITQEMLDGMARDEAISRGDTIPASAEKAKAHSKKKKKKSSSVFLKTCIVVIIIVLVMLIFSVGRIVSLMMQMNQMEKELDELNAEKKELEEQVGQIGTDAYTEKQAREWLKMAKQGELIYTTDGDEAAETADQNDTKQDE